MAALGFTREPNAWPAAGGEPFFAVQLQEAWTEDFGAVLTNSFDTMLVSDYSGQLLAYAAMASPAQPPPLAPVRLGAVAQWSAEHPDRLALVLNRANELLVLRHGALVFAHRAGSWFFLAPDAIVLQMGGPRDLELRRAVYASCLDASFAGTGACIGILNADATARLKEIAPEPADHLLPQRPGKALPLPQSSAKARLLQRAINGQPFRRLIAACARRSWPSMAPPSSITPASSSPPAPFSRCLAAAAVAVAAPPLWPWPPTAWASRFQRMGASRGFGAPPRPPRRDKRERD